MYRKLLIPLFIILIVLSTKITSAFPGAVDSLFLTGAGYNNAVIDADFQVDGKLIIGGSFTSIVGFPTNRIARLDENGKLDLTFNLNGTGANGDILAIKVLADRKILIAGNFTNYNGININRIARLNTDGTLDSTFNPGTGASSSIYQIIIQPDNKILIAGGFSNINGFASRVVARLFYDGSIDQSFVFTPNFSFNDAVRSLALQPDGKILFGGYFYSNDNGLISNIARLDSSGNLDSSFQGRTNEGYNGRPPVSSIIVRSDGRILIGGNFSKVNDVSKNNVALLNTDGTINNSFNTTNVNYVNKLALLNDGRIVVGGGVAIQSQPTDQVVGLLNSNGSSDSTFVSNEAYFSSVVNKIIVTADNKILACGSLSGTSTLFGGATPTGIRRFNLNGTRDYSYITKNGAVSNVIGRPVILSNGKVVLIGQEGVTVGGLARTGLARLNVDGTVDESYSPTLTGSAIAKFSDESILVGGVYSEGRYYLRKISSDGSIDNSFNVEVTPPADYSYSFNPISDMIAQPDGKILVAGTFIAIGGVICKSLIRLNSDGTLDTSFNHNISFDKATFNRVVLQPDGKIWVAGSLTNGTATGSAIFRLNSSGTAETFTPIPFGSGGGISDISPLPNGKTYVGGTFKAIRQENIKYLSRLNQDGTVDSLFSPPTLSNGSYDPIVRSVYAQPDGKVLIGGDFSLVNGVIRRGFARLNSDGSLDTSFGTLVNNTNSLAGNVSSIVKQPDGKILISGQFDEVGGLAKKNVARLLALTTFPTLDFDGDGKSEIGIFRPSAAEWWYQRSIDGATRAVQFGSPNDIRVTPADFTGDGKTDIAFFRPSDGNWFVIRSEDSTYFAFPFGSSGDLPAPADFDGDGKADAAVFRPSQGFWYVNKSSGGTSITQFGIAEDKPVVADYDGDGKADIAIFRPSNNSWWHVRSSDGEFRVYQFALGTDKPVIGDWTGDGKADLATYRPTTGEWFIRKSEDLSYYAVPFGAAGDIPAPGDYDGDGKLDTAVYRPSQRTWYINRSTQGILITQFGIEEDKPLESSFIP